MAEWAEDGSAYAKKGSTARAVVIQYGEKVNAEMPCFGAHQKRVEAHVETKDKKIALVIENVKVSEIKQIMEFIRNMRAQSQK